MFGGSLLGRWGRTTRQGSVPCNWLSSAAAPVRVIPLSFSCAQPSNHSFAVFFCALLYTVAHCSVHAFGCFSRNFQ